MRTNGDEGVQETGAADFGDVQMFACEKDLEMLLSHGVNRRLIGVDNLISRFEVQISPLLLIGVFSVIKSAQPQL